MHSEIKGTESPGTHPQECSQLIFDKEAETMDKRFSVKIMEATASPPQATNETYILVPI